MIKAIAFDFDHTLYDRDKTYDNMVDDFMEYFKDYLRPGVSRAEVLAVMCDCDRTGIYKASHWEGIYADTCSRGIFAKNPTYEQYYDIFLTSHYPGAIALYDDTLSSIKALKDMGLAVGILTNGPSEYQHDKINSVNLQNYVDCVIVGGELPHSKPHPSAFERVCKELGATPSETAYVGDSPFNDVDGARKAGLTEIWFRSVGTWFDELEPPRYYADRLSEIPDIIKKINK